MHVNADGHFFVSGGSDKKVKLWNYDEGSKYFEGVGHSGSVHTVRERGMHNHLACIRVWDRAKAFVARRALTLKALKCKLTPPAVHPHRFELRRMSNASSPSDPREAFTFGRRPVHF